MINKCMTYARHLSSISPSDLVSKVRCPQSAVNSYIYWVCAAKMPLMFNECMIYARHLFEDLKKTVNSHRQIKVDPIVQTNNALI